MSSDRSRPVSRRVVSAVSLTGGVAALVVMAIWGVTALTAPVKDSGDQPAASPTTCAPEDQQIQEFVRRSQVTVSVYNTGKRKNRARATLELLESGGFRAGEIGNGTKGDTVARAEVRTTKVDDPAAKLVALALGRNTKIVVTAEEYGPGVDVFIGDKFGHRLDHKAPRKVALGTPRVTCS